MDELTIRTSGSWQEWLMVAGYLSMLGFVMWRVLLTQKQD